MLSHLTPFRIAILLGFVLSFFRWSGCRPIDLLDVRTTDFRLLQRGRGEVAPEVVIVAIDDKSIEETGRWPWSRAVIARLIEGLTAGGAAVIGFDIVQSEASEVEDVETLHKRLGSLDDRTWQQVQQALQGNSSDDEVLAEAVRRSQRTILGYFFDLKREQTGDRARVGTFNLVAPSREARGEARLPPVVDDEPDSIHVPTAKTNLQAFTDAARETGYFNFLPDRDGTFRRAPMAIRYGDEIAAPLSLAMLRAYRNGAALAIRFNETGVTMLRVGGTEIPVSSQGLMLINYRGPGKTFPHLPASDVLAGRMPADAVRGKLVLVGVTATAVADVRVTPFAPVFPGVEIHANVLDNILRGDFLARPWWAVVAEIALILLSSLLLGIILHYARGVSGALAALGLLVAYLVFSQWAFLTHGLVLTVLYPLLSIGLTYSTISVQHYVVEERERRKTRKALELYLSPSLAAMISDQPERLKLGGEKREHTVLFSDVRDFTTISEQLDADVLVELLNSYLGEMTDVVFENDGMLDKYIGDGIMAVWGAPLPQANHAARACVAALAMVQRLHAKQPQWQAKGWPLIEMRIGLNTGPMTFGNLGSAEHFSLTVVGDNVNLGARLEGLSKLYGTSIIASESTVTAAGSIAIWRELDLVRVKGKLQSVRIYEALGPAEERQRWEPIVELSHAGLQAYRERRWEDAIAKFSSILELRADDGPALFYIDRCRDMQTEPPPEDWDGVTIMDVK